jgi:glyoxylase-like metal-dependent hydrolase (beta-lactamase superfamily II)
VIEDQNRSYRGTQAFTIGAASISRVVEWSGPLRTVGELLPDTPRAVFESDPHLHRHSWNPADDAYLCTIGSWVVRRAGRIIVVDTGVGNDRDRPQAPSLDHLDTPFLDELASLGVAPGDVDIVINTHVHYDHVGWNTRWLEGRWVPTFPNAEYVIPRADHDYFDPGAGRLRAPRTEDEARRFAGIRLVFEDSIAPLAGTGQLSLWSEHLDLGGGVRLQSTPGHTPGSAVVWLEEVDQRAVFVGDLLHSPAQVARPGDRVSFDLDPDLAAASRRAVLREAADASALVLPAHFGGTGAIHVKDDGAGSHAAAEAPRESSTTP